MFAQCNKSIGYSGVYYFFIGFIKNTELGLAMYLNIQLVFLPGESSMTDNAEAGIAAVQAKAAQANGPQQHQKSSIAYLDERISTYLFAIVFMGLLVIWATASSAIIKFGAELQTFRETLVGSRHVLHLVDKNKHNVINTRCIWTHYFILICLQAVRPTPHALQAESPPQT